MGVEATVGYSLHFQKNSTDLKNLSTRYPLLGITVSRQGEFPAKRKENKMLHTEYKLSAVLNSEDELNNAARIVAKCCLDGAIENQEMNGLPVTYEALEEWGFREIINCYLGADTVLGNWFGVQDEVRIAEPCVGTWHDELLIDVKDYEAYEEVLRLACVKIEEYTSKCLERE